MFWGCQDSRNSTDPKARDLKKPYAVCASESELMATGIVNGNIVNKDDVDSNAVVLLLSANSLCTAAPIAPDILLTAAHCVSDDPKEIVAAFYPSMSCESGFNITKHSIRVARIAKHTGYDVSQPIESRSHDVAIIFLKQSIPKNYPVYKIANPHEIDGSQSMYLYGFGIIGEKKGGRGFLRKAIVEPNRYAINLAESHVRVDQKDSTGFCMGDSGGPAFVKINNEMQILGVNSYVRGREGEICNGYGYQTLAHSYLSWIQFQK